MILSKAKIDNAIKYLFFNVLISIHTMETKNYNLYVHLNYLFYKKQQTTNT